MCCFRLNESLGERTAPSATKRKNACVIVLKRRYVIFSAPLASRVFRGCKGAYILPARSFVSRRDYSLSTRGLCGNRTGGVANWLFDWKTDWLTDRLIHWQSVWLIDQLADWLHDFSLTHWLIRSRTAWLSNTVALWQIDSLTDFLANWVTD